MKRTINVDDHVHNHGFLHQNHGHWRLAPAFDLNPFPERARELKTWISEDRTRGNHRRADVGDRLPFLIPKLERHPASPLLSRPG
jgi:hypothetical protein